MDKGYNQILDELFGNEAAVAENVHRNKLSQRIGGPKKRVYFSVTA